MYLVVGNGLVEVKGFVKGEKFGLLTYERNLVMDHWFGHDSTV